jgi:3-phosphoshikimate 1-carboxyvinyltransferase
MLTGMGHEDYRLTSKTADSFRMATLKSRKLKSIPAEITVPGDKSISHRSAMFAGLAKGTTVIDGFLPSEDCLCTVKAMQALGAEVQPLEEVEGIGLVKLAITGKGAKLQAPAHPIDCGNSGTTTRLLCGILAGQSFTTELFGDPSLSKRPMKRVADPLGQMGARIEGQGEKICAPLKVSGGHLLPLHYKLPVASAQVKSAVLLAGLFAQGKTTVVEPVATRNHTERLFSHFGIRWQREKDAVSVDGPQEPQARDIVVPGDISSAAFWLVAVAASPGSQIVIKNVGLNPTRTGILDVLLRMGAQVTRSELQSEGEPRGNILVKGGQLSATVIGGTEIPNVIDELPILAVAGALARGKTLIRDAEELRVKETDRIAAVAHNLRLMGVNVTERPDGMEIEGGAKLHGATLPCFGDHRIAMAFAIAGLFAEGTTTIEGSECIATSYPGFEHHLDLFLQGVAGAQTSPSPSSTTPH